jgi:predicted transcriptional regulator
MRTSPENAIVTVRVGGRVDDVVVDDEVDVGPDDAGALEADGNTAVVDGTLATAAVQADRHTAASSVVPRRAARPGVVYCTDPH